MAVAAQKPVAYLLHIKRGIEMGNARPLHLNVFVYYHFRSVIKPVEIIIDIFQHLGGQGLTLFDHLMDDFFIFGEHGLPVNRAAKLLQIVIDQVNALFTVLAAFEQVIDEQ